MIREKEVNKYIFLTLSVVIFLSSVGIFIFLFLQNKSDYIHHSNCVAPIGSYILEHGIVSTNVIRKCGINGDEPCQKKVNNVSEAVAYCNQNSSFCNRFNYQQDTVSIVSLKGEMQRSSNSNVYTRIAGISYNRGRSSVKASTSLGRSIFTSADSTNTSSSGGLLSFLTGGTTTTSGGGGGGGGYSAPTTGGGGGGGGY